ncbi:Ribonuclease E [Planctomycetes bacterium Pla163]|uniref:Ribonuclease G n=1 Tax=Rohdeia mirabilis TaxID=2528008 RepID=A0A518D2R0_9BACT|nr:Ribonuclease E [Planctomycetes bacterium Pla163]
MTDHPHSDSRSGSGDDRPESFDGFSDGAPFDHVDAFDAPVLEPAPDSDPGGSSAATDDYSSETGTKRRRTRGGRGRRRRRTAAEDALEREDAEDRNGPVAEDRDDRERAASDDEDRDDEDRDDDDRGDESASDGRAARSRPRRTRRDRTRRSRSDDGEEGDDAPREEVRASARRDDDDRDNDDRDDDDREPQVASREDAEDDGEETPKKRRRRGSRGGRRRRKTRNEDDEQDGDERASGDARPATRTTSKAASRTADDDSDAPARSGRRGRRSAASSSDRPRRSEADERDRDSDTGALSVDAIPGEDDDMDASEAPRRRGRRSRRGSRSESTEPRDDRDSDQDRDDQEDSGHRSVAPRKRRRSRKKQVEVPEEAAGRRKSSRKRRASEHDDDDDDDGSTSASRAREAAIVRDQLILVNAVDPEETRVVVQEGDRIVDLVMTVDQHKSFVNDIYRGRVVNIEEAIGAAFVDFGQGRNGFLHASDVMHIYGDENWRVDKLLTARTDVDEWGDDSRAPTESIAEEDEDAPSAKASKKKGRSNKKQGRSIRPRGRKRLAVTELLKRGQLVVAQITKDAIGDKGPTLTTYISIPGRYLVLMPSLEKTGVSRKIEDERERRRLKRILQSLDIPEGMGVIVRTAGVGKTKADIRRDLDYLLAVWDQFSKSLVLGRNPAPLYQESAVAIRTMRDLFSSRTKAVIVDDEAVYQEMREFTEKLMPEHLDRIQLHDGDRPLFHTYGLEQDFERLFSRRVELPSGGSIVFDQTEALVAIDVNSGRTRDEGADFEDIALKANLEAVPEIARQIKLRDLGGIIVCDFIDMMRPASRRKVERALQTLLAEDRARNKLGRISQFGLLELTRQRLGPGLSTLLYEPCNYCRGTGRRRTAQSKAQAVLRRLASALTQKGFTKVEILIHPDTLDWLRKHDWKEVEELEKKSKRELVFVSAEDQYEDSVFHYLRADGREVRPGGRRRR